MFDVHLEALQMKAGMGIGRVYDFCITDNICHYTGFLQTRYVLQFVAPDEKLRTRKPMLLDDLSRQQRAKERIPKRRHQNSILKISP